MFVSRAAKAFLDVFQSLFHCAVLGMQAPQPLQIIAVFGMRITESAQLFGMLFYGITEHLFQVADAVSHRGVAGLQLCLLGRKRIMRTLQVADVMP